MTASSVSGPPVTRADPIPVFPILSVTFVGTLGFSIVLPFLVFLVTRLGGNALIYGIMGATYSAFQLLGAPILGRWSDRYGRRRILLLSQLGTLASWAIFLGALFLPVTPLLRVDSAVLGTFTVTVPLVILFVARALDGVTGGNVSVANAYLADITPEPERAAQFGRMAVAANLGFIVGPAIAGLLGATAAGEVPPVIAALAISATASVMIATMLRDPAPCVLRADPARPDTGTVLGQELKECYEVAGADRVATSRILRIPGIRRLLGMYFAVYLAFNFFYIAFPVYAVGVLAWDLTDTGLFFAVLGLLMAVVQGPVLKRASARFTDAALMRAGSAALATSFLLFTIPSVPGVYAGTALLALGNGLLWPSLLAVLSKATGADMQGAVQGFAGSAGAVASILGLIVGGVLYGLLGGSVFVLSAGVTLVVFAVTLVPARSPAV